MAKLLTHGNISSVINLESSLGNKACHLIVVGPSGEQLRNNLVASSVLFALWHSVVGVWSYLASEWKRDGTKVPHYFGAQTPQTLPPQDEWPDFDELRVHQLIVAGHIDKWVNGEGQDKRPYFGVVTSPGGNQFLDAIEPSGRIWATGDNWASVDANWKTPTGESIIDADEGRVVRLVACDPPP